MMTRRDFETLLLTLESTPALLARAAAAFSPARRACGRTRGRLLVRRERLASGGPRARGLRPRIDRILAEENPALPNFDGERTARERGYQERDVDRGLALFARARARNLERLRSVSGADWNRAGSQEGVGRVTLADLPRMMAEHDRSHGDESPTCSRSSRARRSRASRTAARPSVAFIIGMVRCPEGCSGDPRPKSAAPKGSARRPSPPDAPSTTPARPR